MKYHISRKHVVLLLAALFVVFMVFWSRTSVDEAGAPDMQVTYGFARETPWWNLDLWINDQPALHMEDNSAGLWMITEFVVDGRNTVRISAHRNPNMVFGTDDRGECSLKLIKEKHTRDFTSYDGFYHMHEPDGSEKELLQDEFGFDASVPIRWRWQDADDIDNLSEQDRTDILDMFRRLVTAYKSYDKDVIIPLFSPWWYSRPTLAGNDLPPGDIHEYCKTATDLVRGYELFVAPEEEIVLVAGTKIVMMYRPGTELQFSGHHRRALISVDREFPVATNQPEGTRWEVHREAIFDVLYFIKTNGQWEMMLPDWRL